MLNLCDYDLNLINSIRVMNLNNKIEFSVWEMWKEQINITMYHKLGFLERVLRWTLRPINTCVREREKVAFGNRSSWTLIFTWWHLDQLHVKVQAKNSLLQLSFTCQNHLTFTHLPPSVIWCELFLEGLDLGWSSLKLKSSLKVLPTKVCLKTASFAPKATIFFKGKFEQQVLFRGEM